MKLGFSKNEIVAHNKAIVATVRAMNAPEKVVRDIENALNGKQEYYVKTECMEARYDDNGFILIIDERIGVDAANTWAKHAPIIVASVNTLIQAMKLFNQELVEKVTSKLDNLKVAIKKATTKDEEKSDGFEKEMAKILFKDGVAKVTVKMQNGDEKVIRRSLDDDTPEAKLKDWDEI